MTLTDVAEVLAHELDAETAKRVVAALCRHAAGDRLYISRPPRRPEVQPGDTVASLLARYPICRRTAYYWINARNGDAPARQARTEATPA